MKAILFPLLFVIVCADLINYDTPTFLHPGFVAVLEQNKTAIQGCVPQGKVTFSLIKENNNSIMAAESWYGELCTALFNTNNTAGSNLITNLPFNSSATDTTKTLIRLYLGENYTGVVANFDQTTITNTTDGKQSIISDFLIDFSLIANASGDTYNVTFTRKSGTVIGVAVSLLVGFVAVYAF